MHRPGSNRRRYHIDCEVGDLAGYLLVPGDPDRVPKIARLWETAKEVATHREFASFTGRYKGVDISALSSGIGPACMAIAVNEASSIGVHTFIRIGSTGAIQRAVKCGDIIISSGAVRFDCTSNCYIVPEYPAVASYEILLALIEAAERLHIDSYHVGVTATTADFYAGQSRQTSPGSLQGTGGTLHALRKAGVLSFEMETATLFTLAGLFGLRAGSVCAVYANRCTNEFEAGAGEEDAIRVGNEAVKILSDWDSLKRRKKRKWLSPSLLGSKR